MQPETDELIHGTLAGDHGAIARLISLVEAGGDDAAPGAIAQPHPHTGTAYTVGITGAPGAGKSTLTDGLVARLRRDGVTVGVLAVDPTSPFTGGAILGDRVRMQDHATDNGVFIRSMATRGHHGGLSLATPQAVRVLDAAGTPWVIIETVGVGQVEVEVAGAADTTVVVVNPGWGDGVQTSKAGLLEIADVFVVNKADRPGVDDAVRDLDQMLELSAAHDWRPPIVRTIAVDGQGIDELWDAVERHHAFMETDGRLEARRDARLREEVRSIVMAHIARRAGDVCTGDRFDAAVAHVAARDIDPYTAAEQLLAHEQEQPVEHGEALIEVLNWQRAGCLSLDSPFYAALCEQLILDVEADGPITRVLAPFARQPFEAAYVLRLLAGVHRLVLSGGAPALARHYPSIGGDGDTVAAAARMGEVMTSPPAEVVDALSRPPQTNEVGRSVALASGLMLVADELGLPLSLREIGASAGLNLRLDAYWYEQDGRGWGDQTSPVRFVDLWSGGVPPFAAGTVIADRRGCDPNPIDVTGDDGAVALMSYVWPEPEERFAQKVRAAIGIPRENPVAIEPVPVEDWLARQLAARPPGTALVFMHSVVWQYLDPATKTLVTRQLEDAGRHASASAPLAWLRLEPSAVTYVPAELRLTVWNGDADALPERRLATTNFHGGRIIWTGGRSSTRE